MRFRPGRALILLASALVLGLAARGEGEAVFVSRIAWTLDDGRFGGWSGVDMIPGDGAAGTRFAAISDRGWIVDGRINRGPSGRISDVSVGAFRRLGDRAAKPFFPREHRDSEGLAITPEGRVLVAYERLQRVFSYPDLSATNPTVLPIYRDFIGFYANSGLEALAVGPEGAVYTLPEVAAGGGGPVPIYRHDGTAWEIVAQLPDRADRFQPVGADIGPDGRFYLLERKVIERMGFASRVRRFDLTGDGLANETLLVSTRVATHDNLEGLAVWQGADGRIRLTMVSDDNFGRWQVSEIVEYLVP